ncbi:MAG: 2,3-diaminopropionate biosynthesis protein SbnA [Bacteroidota bacterium]
MTQFLNSALENVGHTPCVALKIPDAAPVQVFAKLEMNNPTGSVKDRAASHILSTLLAQGTIDKDTTIIESTSGNFGVALSAFCKYHGLRFIAVVDPHITLINEMLIAANGAEIVKVDQADDFGGYLLSRIATVRELTQSIENCYWVNQYENPLNAEAYYLSLGGEICEQFSELDYLFIGVSSGGTITGLSRKMKENFPDIRIVAIDVAGSKIFEGNSPRKRFIPGIGSSMRPPILQQAYIDDVVIVDDLDTCQGCQDLLAHQSIFAGGSSGSVYAGLQRYFADRKLEQPANALALLPDRGERYFNTVYNAEWVQKVVSHSEIAV